MGAAPRPGAARVAMLLGNPCTHDARVEREARTLAASGREVTIFAVAAPGLPAEETRDGFRIVRSDPPGWTGWTGPARLVPLLRWFARCGFLARAAAPWRPTVVHGHDLETLLPAERLARGLGVPWVHDDHEVGIEKLPALTPPDLGGARRAVQDRVTERLVRRAGRLQRALFPRAAAVITVSAGCADVLRPYGADPVVLRNLPEWRDLPPDPRLLGRAGLAPGTRVALCQGTMTEATAPDACVSAAAHLPDGWAVVFLGVTWMRARLEEQARREGLSARVRFLDAVPPSELPGFTRAAAVGLAPVRVLNESERRGLSNKVFEHLHAGIPTVTSAGTAQEAFVRETGAGEAIEGLDPRAIAAAALRQGGVPEAEARARAERLRALAKASWSWESEAPILARLYDRIGA
jgi:glycosyltransferase involved in cell wall biosynthesis